MISMRRGDGDGEEVCAEHRPFFLPPFPPYLTHSRHIWPTRKYPPLHWKEEILWRNSRWTLEVASDMTVRLNYVKAKNLWKTYTSTKFYGAIDCSTLQMAKLDPVGRRCNHASELGHHDVCTRISGGHRRSSRGGRTALHDGLRFGRIQA